MKSAKDELDEHLAEHNCHEWRESSPDYIGGFIHCPVAAKLWDAIPDDSPDKVLIA